MAIQEDAQEEGTNMRESGSKRCEMRGGTSFLHQLGPCSGFIGLHSSWD